MINQLDEEGRPHGSWVYYHDNGNIKLAANYHHGKLHGVYKKFYHNGVLSESKKFVNGYWEGLRSWNDSDGRVLLKGSYSRSKCVGLFYKIWDK